MQTGRWTKRLAGAAAGMLLAVVLGAPSGKASEKDAERVGFDQGVDSSKILKKAIKAAGLDQNPPRRPHVARTFAPLPPDFKKIAIPSKPIRILWPPQLNPQQPCIDYPPEQDDPGGEIRNFCDNPAAPKGLPPTRKAAVGLATPAPSAVLGPFAAKAKDSMVYQQGLALQPQLAALPPSPARDKLLDDWKGFEADRDSLIGAGADLDVYDDNLDANRTRLQTWDHTFGLRLQMIQDYGRQYDAGCGGLRPPDEVAACNQWVASINSCIGRHNASGQRGSAELKRWSAARDCLKVNGDDFLNKVAGWEKAIQDWIGNANDLLNCIPLSNLALDPASPPPLETGGATQEFHAIISFGSAALFANSCPIALTWNVTGKIGTLSFPDPNDSTRSLLTTGMQASTGAVTVEVTDRKNQKKKIAFAPVSVSQEGESAIRIQAQGSDIPDPAGKSVALNLPGFIYLSQCKQLLGQLREELTPRELAARQQALINVNRWMENAAAGGGQGPMDHQKSFFDDPAKPDIRIDLQVLRGRACVPDPSKR